MLRKKKNLLLFDVSDEIQGNIAVYENFTAEDCCFACHSTPGCVFWDPDGTQCIITLTEFAPPNGNPTPTCPQGIYQALPFSESGNTEVGIFGPCDLLPAS
jgi:hypothetical protein